MPYHVLGGDTEYINTTFQTTVEIKEPDPNDLAEMYLNVEPKFEDLFGLKPEWEKGVFFNSLEEAWPGIETIDEEGDDLMSKQDWLFEQTTFLNELFERQKSGWRAFPCRDDKDGSFVLLHSNIGETGEYVLQKIKIGQLITQEKLEPIVSWEVISLVVGSYESSDVIVFDELIKSNTPNLRVMMRTQYLEKEGESNKLMSFFSSSEDLLLVQNPDLEVDNLFGFLHELSHAKEHNYFKGQYAQLLNEARSISKLDIASRNKHKKELKERDKFLSPETAYRVIVREERRAWTASATLLKILHEKAKERGVKFNFGDFATRRGLLDYSEPNLRSYDHMPLNLKDLASDEIPTFSQQNRAQARKLEEDIKSGKVARAKAFRASFDGMTAQYLGADIEKIRRRSLQTTE